MLDIDLILDRMLAKRDELGWTQREFAEKAEVSFEYVNRIESRHQLPSLTMLERLGYALHMDIDELFFGADMDGAMYLVPDIQKHYCAWSDDTRKVFFNLASSMNEMDVALKNTRLKYVQKKW